MLPLELLDPHDLQLDCGPKDIGSLYDTFVSHPSLQHKRAALLWISLSWRFEPDSLVVCLTPLHTLYDCAVHARDNWLDIPIDLGLQTPRGDWKRLSEEGWTLGEAFQLRVFGLLANFAQPEVAPPSVARRARELLLALKPPNPRSPLYERWARLAGRANRKN